ncbi:hypothetical protein AWW66_14815 [Micromonospora rosaria]|uniref:Uncharacterized protein n=1 Tax=Micromonospora rosaria TaxID=47874 RepID=A0A136PRU4_9ACTN|nr:hypothetical protein [Micromonospora rosaria]KXK61180.1 hypothetical protein AWW66_14815 [Micromonospora rosaria]
MTGEHTAPARRGLVTVLAAGAFAGWFWASVAAAHPSEMFNRVRRLDRNGIFLPNWRFFAPHPACFDYGLIYRVEEHDGTVSPWRFVMEPVHRTWAHTVWFPTRRRSKALFDVAAELLVVGRKLAERGTVTAEVVEAHPAYTVLRDFTGAVVRERQRGDAPPAGFQFALIEHAGYDELQEEPTYVLISSFVPLTEQAR